MKHLKNVFTHIPTLAPGRSWEIDSTLSSGNATIYKDEHPEEKNRAVKAFKSQILVPPTDKHRAEIEKWEENAVVGKYVKTNWSGMIPVAEKSRLLGNLDNLISEVKKARQRANQAEVVDLDIVDQLFTIIMK